jgi:hypothetical protein
MDDKVSVNHLGLKQYVNTSDENACIACGTLYTNEGEGLLCPHCVEQLVDDQE